MDQRAREREFLLHASRETLGQASPERRETGELQKLFSTFLVVKDPMDLSKELNVLVDT